MSNDKHSVTVVELLGHREHDLLILEPHPTRERSMGIYWSPWLQGVLDKITEPEGYDGLPHDMTVRFFPYKAGQETVPEQLRGELRLRGSFNEPGPF
jgi:hypothetical protein